MQESTTRGFLDDFCLKIGYGKWLILLNSFQRGDGSVGDNLE